MQENLPTRVTKLIESLYISEEIKAGLLQRVASSGITKQLILDLKKRIDESIAEYERQIDSEVKALQDKLNSSVVGFNEEFKQIEQDVKIHEKQVIKEKDTQELEKVRAKLADIN